jgi:hypothetical protein
MQKRKVIGFDRRIDREWLDSLLDRVATTSDVPALRQFVQQLLEPRHPGEVARGKTATVLMRLWVLVPAEHRTVHADAIALLPSIPAKDRIWLHWGMALLAYPLFRDAATAIGRLLKLQGDFTLAQLERRLVESWGDRSTLRRAAQRIVRSMVQWGLLHDLGRGKFTAAERLVTGSKEVQMWLLEASHLSEMGAELESNQLMNLPTSFPFKLTISVGDLRRSQVFTIHRQGLDMDMVALTPRQRCAVI